MKHNATAALDARVARFTGSAIRTNPATLAEALQGPLLSIGEKVERLRVRSLVLERSADATRLAIAARNEATWAEGSREACLARAKRHDAIADAMNELLTAIGPMPRSH